MIIETGTTLRVVKDNSKEQRRHAAYISDFNLVPAEMLDGIINAFNKARPDHAIGIYSFFFSPIYIKRLAERYIVYDKKKRLKLAKSSYVQKYIIGPAYKEIKIACKNIGEVGIVSDDSISQIHRSYTPEE